MKNANEAINQPSHLPGHSPNEGTLTEGLTNDAATSKNAAPARSEPFAAYIAHELRTALATQRALLELALTDPDADIAAWRDVGHDVLTACKQQERVLTACITLSRSEVDLDRYEILDLSATIAELLQTTDLHGRTATVSLEPAPTTGDPVLIERLLDNLVTNAIRHNDPSGWIAITAGARARRAVVTIENTGTPILADELARLFEPFEQIGPTSPEAGLGLGLAVVKTIAATHGAYINAHARPGGGLRIEIAFPLATAASPTPWTPFAPKGGSSSATRLEPVDAQLNPGQS